MYLAAILPGIDITKVLGLGAIGLGFLLAVLAYLLLRKEQDKNSPRKQMLQSVYVFMGFSLLLAAFGFSEEIFRDNNSHSLRTQTMHDANVDSIKQARYKLSFLLEQKGGLLQQLSELQPNAPGYAAILKQLTKQIVATDKTLAAAIPKTAGDSTQVSAAP